MAEERDRRRLAAILAADVVGYSRLMGQDEAGTLAALRQRREGVLNPLIAKHHGRIFKLTGDGVLVEFGSAVDAVQCAVELQQAMRSQPDDLDLVLRIGITLGDVIVEDGDLYGDGVNIAARLEAIAEPGGILLSGTAFDHIKGKVKVGFEDIGAQSLKNIAEPVRAYRVTGSLGAIALASKPFSGKPSIAVLPFDNMSADPEQAYFSDGITEDIITELSRFRSLAVIARNSSFSFKGRSTNVSEIGRVLSARYVVEGSVRKVGRRVRITAQLIEAATGRHVWAERYDRDLEEIFAVQDEVTERIVWALTGKVEVAEIARSKMRRVENLDAYDLVLRGNDLLNRYTAESTAAAIKLIKKASVIDPNCGRILSWLARAYWQAGFINYDPQQFDLALEAADRAIAFGDAEDWTEAVVAHIVGWRRDLHEAEIRLSRAVAKNPHDAMTTEARIYVLLWEGKPEKAREMAERVVRLDPVNPQWFQEFLSYANYLTGDYEGSFQAFKRCMPVGYYRSYAHFAACLGQLGKIEEAQGAWRRCLELRPGFTVEEFDRESPYQLRDRERWLDGLRKAGLKE